MNHHQKFYTLHVSRAIAKEPETPLETYKKSGLSMEKKIKTQNMQAKFTREGSVESEKMTLVTFHAFLAQQC